MYQFGNTADKSLFHRFSFFFWSIFITLSEYFRVVGIVWVLVSNSLTLYVLLSALKVGCHWMISPLKNIGQRTLNQWTQYNTIQHSTHMYLFTSHVFQLTTKYSKIYFILYSKNNLWIHCEEVQKESFTHTHTHSGVYRTELVL